MRFFFCTALLALAACGQTSAPAAKAPDPPPSQPAALSGPIVVRGDGWRMDIDREMGMSLGITEGAQTWAAPYVVPQRTALGYRIASGDLTVELEPVECTTEGGAYPFTAVVLANGHETLSGCAAERWDTQLLQLMPQIDACILVAPEARRVTYAGPRGDGHFVRLWSESGGIDCTVSASGVAQLGMRDNSVKIGDENEAIFVRGPGENPGGECFEAPEVRGAGGELLGWMDDPHGC